jgi:hypothetical protein
MTKFTVVILAAATLSGCATNSGVVPMGPDTFMVSRQAASGFSGMGSLKADAYREAGEFCLKTGKTVRVISTNESQPPYIFGNFPRAEVNFMCLSSGDPELTRPKPAPAAH